MSNGSRVAVIAAMSFAGAVGALMLFDDSQYRAPIDDIPVTGWAFVVLSVLGPLLVVAADRQDAPRFRKLVVWGWCTFMLLDLHGCLPIAPAKGRLACPTSDECTVAPYRLLRCPRSDSGRGGINTTCDGDGQATMVVVTLAALFQLGLTAAALSALDPSQQGARQPPTDEAT